jgi:cellobiose phosphorylase
VESLIGLHLEVDKLRIAPCLPREWDSFKLHYRYGETFYHITIHLTDKRTADETVTTQRMTLDGVELTDDFVCLVDDHQDHEVDVILQTR